MKKIIFLMYTLIFVFFTIGMASAANVNYSFTGNCGKKTSFMFTYDYGEVDNLTVTADTKRSGSWRSASVVQMNNAGGEGLGVNWGWADVDSIDGVYGDDRLIFTFDSEVQLESITFTFVSLVSEKVKLYVNGSTHSTFYITSNNGGKKVFDTPISGTVFGVRAPGGADDYRVSHISVIMPIDIDEDGYKEDVDCDESDPDINPGATDICGDGIDQDCNGSDPSCVDNDGDGYYAGEDCNDNDPAIYPHDSEVHCDGIDQDCDGNDPCFDYDGDGYMENADCDEGNPAINPGATDICGDGIDQDCNGSDMTCVDSDGDSYFAGVDCNDSDPDIHPGATEICDDGIDQDCTGSDRGCTEPPSCIYDLNNWKLKHQPRNSACISCHTVCIPAPGAHTCTPESAWNHTENDCRNCHGATH